MSNPRVVLSGTVSRGKLRLHVRDTERRQLLRWRDGTPLTVTVEKKHANRSAAQNAYLWSTVYATILDERLSEQGWTEDDLHFFCKARFLSKRLAICDGNGEVVEDCVLGGSTTRLTVVQFCEFIDAIIQWSAEKLHVAVPPADPNWRQNAHE